MGQAEVLQAVAVAVEELETHKVQVPTVVATAPAEQERHQLLEPLILVVAVVVELLKMWLFRLVRLVVQVYL